MTDAPSAAKAPAKPAATPKPLYAWEVRDAPGAPRAPTLETDLGAFLATDVAGVYATSGAGQRRATGVFFRANFA